MKSAVLATTLFALTFAVKLEGSSSFDRGHGGRADSRDREEQWSEMANLLDSNDDGVLEGDELQGFETLDDLHQAWRFNGWDISDDDFVQATFDDFDKDRLAVIESRKIGKSAEGDVNV